MKKLTSILLVALMVCAILSLFAVSVSAASKGSGESFGEIKGQDNPEDPEEPEEPGGEGQEKQESREDLQSRKAELEKKISGLIDSIRKDKASVLLDEERIKNCEQGLENTKGKGEEELASIKEEINNLKSSIEMTKKTIDGNEEKIGEAVFEIDEIDRKLQSLGTGSTLSQGYPEIVYAIAGLAVGVAGTLLLTKKKKSA